MVVVRRLNNNVVLVSEDNQEMVVMGKGIGFQVYPGDSINPTLVEKTFLPSSKASLERMAEIINQVSYELIILSNEIISLGKEMLQQELNSNLIVTLSDHINFALKRFEDGIALRNPLHWEIKQLYLHEVEVGRKALDLIEAKIGIRLPDEEAVFIAMHFVNAQIDFETMNTTVELTSIMGEVLNIVQYHFQTILDEQSLNFTRFLTHLRYFLIRQMNNEPFPIKDEYLFEVVKRKYVREFECTEKIARFLQQSYGWETTPDEKLYLTLHINRVVSRT
ncbi:BglG family transcription antiterminator LicT [Culicoidibacter larvae]|uniref:PRD domain-containing protein n=1 Tax=Culicoidibacter larvae TaxID=2579976 RepID=A0A5R8QEK3_9FIRM|nr:PRD domain-containing protein [Culicoidibacter larvae]TLG75406.1 PRD domain-containing protein [Culicoidibacter larvae]